MNFLPRVISGNSICDAWLDAYRLLLEEGESFHIILHIKQPCIFNIRDLLGYDPAKVNWRVVPLLDVANTIFPRRTLKWDLSVVDFCRAYEPLYEKLLSRGRRAWGCYFLRLIDFGGTGINQLERVVQGLGNWGKNHKAAFVVHFSASVLDKPRPLGAPCLQYVQFGVDSGGRLSMTAVYRSHDYFQKALGNLLGLSRLLEYVAYKSGHEVGTITCLSSYAFLGSKTKHEAEALIRG